MKYTLLKLLAGALDSVHLCPDALAKYILLFMFTEEASLRASLHGFNQENNTVELILRGKNSILDGIVVGVDINFANIFNEMGIENVPLSVKGFPSAIKNYMHKESMKSMENEDYQSDAIGYYMAGMRLMIIPQMCEQFAEYKSGLANV